MLHSKLYKFNVDSKVILAIRRAEHLKRLVYVACNAKAAMNNFVEWVDAAVQIQSDWRPVLQKPYIRNNFLVFAEHRLTEFTGRPSGRCGPWPWICSLRPCTWRCFCSWREWTTIPSSNSPAALRKRPETEPIQWAVALVLHNRFAYISGTSALTSALFHVKILKSCFKRSHPLRSQFQYSVLYQAELFSLKLCSWVSSMF